MSTTTARTFREPFFLKVGSVSLEQLQSAAEWHPPKGDRVPAKQGEIFPGFLKAPACFLTILISLLSLFLITLSADAAETSPLITSVEILGNRKISASTISSKMSSREGSPFSKKTVQEDIKKLHSIGYFDDIRVEIESFEGGVRLIYIFIEKPSVASLDFQGNEKFEADELKEKITLTTGAIANQSLIADNAKMLSLFYQSEGYWLARIVPIIREISEDSVALTYQIEEGPEVSVDEIVIRGNSALSEKEIFKVMQTREWGIFSFITGSGVYREDQIRSDIQRIRDLYQSKGYVYIAVSEPEITLSPDKKDLYLTISLSEGDQYNVGALSVKGNTILSEAELLERIETAPGKVFDRTALKKDIDAIIDTYMDRGYARADVNPLVDTDREKRLANIILSVNEGGLYRIGRINVLGNLKTRDKVIRREMRLDEGDIFSKSHLKRSYQRINNLNYFENVDVRPTPRVDEELMDIDINVKEKMTGMLSLGGGYSSVDKFMVMGEITQMNLFGKGLYLKLKADLSARRANYNISLRDPWFMDKPLSASFSLYNDEIDYLDYDKKATGGSIGFGKELTEYITASIRYELEDVEITDIASDASALIRDQEGSKITSSISPSIWRDSRDNYIDPSQGSKNALYMTFAGLGGDNYFYKAVVDSLWYFPLFWDTTFSLRGRYGHAEGYNNEQLPLYERFYVGGINTVRGLGFGEAGPENDEGERIGGTRELIFNAEYIFPILKDFKLKGVVFYDYGTSFDDNEGVEFDLSNMRQTAGAGVRWISPFGPIRLEWGFNLDPKEGESKDKLEFSMGGLF